MAGKTIILGSLVGLLLASGCAKTRGPVGLQAAAKDERPVIVRLVSRDRTVTISKGVNGPVYSVHDVKGKALLSFVSREELRVRHPDLSYMLDTAIASSAQPIQANFERMNQAQQAPANFMPALDGPLMRHGE